MKPLQKLRRAAAGGACWLALLGLLGALIPIGTTGAAGALPLLGTTGSGGAPYMPQTKPTTPTTPYPPPPKDAAANPFAARAMWIWELPSTEGGNVTAIIARAKANGIRTLMIKSGDAGNMWSQFSPQLVAQLHAANLRVCAWQYVYGSQPLAEAAVGAQAVKNGADCLLIDAEVEYEGKYVSAQRYVTSLRKAIGPAFPLALAGFPYIDYHPAFPYSVFLGPGGAQYNVPQMYWHDIGTTVDGVFSHTYSYNMVYQRPIFPLGQVYNAPPIRQVTRFRQLSRVYAAGGVSWWDWQEATPAYFRAISRPVGVLHNVAANAPLATLTRSSQGDMVVWAQEHLDGYGFKLPIDGSFGRNTLFAVDEFQSAVGLPVTGVIDPATWAALLKVKPITPKWVIRRKGVVAVPAFAARTNGPLVAPVPGSARLPDRGQEIPPSLGAGVP
jgi:hypothetical protein